MFPVYVRSADATTSIDVRCPVTMLATNEMAFVFRTEMPNPMSGGFSPLARITLPIT